MLENCYLIHCRQCVKGQERDNFRSNSVIVCFFPLLVYDSNHGAEAHRIGGFGLEDSFRPTMHHNTEDAHRTSIPTKPSSYEHTFVSCIYDKEGTRVKPEQMQRHELSVNVPCCNVHLYPKDNEHHAKLEAHMTDNRDPKVLVEYDNFPPNKTIGPEMKVVIPPIPTQNNFSRSSPKDNGCQVQYPHVRATGDRFSHFSPIHATEAQDFTDSDSDWENEAMAGFGGFMWCTIRVNVKKATCIIRAHVKRKLHVSEEAIYSWLFV